MPVILVLAFVVVPLVELVVIIQVAAVIDTSWTIALLVADSLIGAYLLKRESRRAWQDFRDALSAGRWPGDEVTQGGLVIVGGALLLTPGFVTDVVGLLCLLPPSRAVASRLIRARVGPATGFGSGTTTTTTGDAPRRARPGRTSPGEPNVLDVEVVDVQREPPPERDAD